MKIAIGNDHVAVDLKWEIYRHLAGQGYELLNFGTDSSARADYPIYGYRVAKEISDGRADCGILLCGTGVGISLAANKVRTIRAAVCSDPYTAMLSKKHNNTNIIALGSRVVGCELAKMIVDCWLRAEFEGGRHTDRVNMIAGIEDGAFSDTDLYNW